MKTSTPTKALASSDSAANVVKCSSSAANKKKKVAEEVIKNTKMNKAAEEVIKKNKEKNQEKMETSNATTDNNESKKKTKKKKNDDEEVCSFPMARVGRLVRTGEFGTYSDNIRPSQDAVFLINKASEMFLNRFTEDAFTKASSLSADRSKNSPFLTYHHLSSIVSTGKPYEFLSDYVPEKVKAEEALKLWASCKSQSSIRSTNALKIENNN